MRNRCQPHSLRLACLPPDLSKLFYSPPINIWLPSYVMKKTVLPNMMFISLPECNNIKVSACSSLHCVTNNGVTSINSTQFSLTNLIPCTSYSINIFMHNNSIWTEQVNTPARPKFTVLLFETTGKINTSYNTDCPLPKSSRSLRICKIIQVQHEESKDNHLSGLVKEVKNGCFDITLEDQKLDAILELTGLEPCTKYSFSLHILYFLDDGGKSFEEERTIMDTTECLNIVSDSNIFPPFSIVGAIIIIIIFISLVIITIALVRRRNLLRKPSYSEAVLLL